MSISMLGDGCRYCQPQEYIDRLSEILDEERDHLSDAQAIIDGLRDQIHVAHEKVGRYADQRDQQAQRIGELAAQANVNCKNTAYYLRKYRPDLADICSGWCAAIDAALAAGKEGE